MVNRELHHEPVSHNAAITARPRILIPATSQTNDGFVLRVSKTGPQRIPADLEGEKFFAEWGIERFEPVKEFVVKEVLDFSEEAHARVRALSLLRYAHATHASDALAAKKAVSDAAGLLIDDQGLQSVFSTGNPREVATLFYPAFFTREIRGAEVVMWKTKDEQFLPAIYCPNSRIASFVAISYRGLAACLNCHKVFSPEEESVDGSVSEKYCTVACGQRYRQKLYRLKQKARVKKISKRKGQRRW